MPHKALVGVPTYVIIQEVHAQNMTNNIKVNTSHITGKKLSVIRIKCYMCKMPQLYINVCEPSLE